jgi:hypothetical protein
MTKFEDVRVHIFDNEDSRAFQFPDATTQLQHMHMSDKEKNSISDRGPANQRMKC